MQSVAFAPPVWAATLRSLRRLTRMAATALVLVVGLNGLTAPVPADPVRPVSTVRPLADLRLTPGPLDAPAGLPLAAPVDAAPGLHPATVARTSVAGTADSPTRHLRVASAAPATGVPASPVEPDAAPARTTAAVVPPAGPGREPATRRGPPRA